MITKHQIMLFLLFILEDYVKILDIGIISKLVWIHTSKTWKFKGLFPFLFMEFMPPHRWARQIEWF